MELCYALCLILLNSVMLYQGCFADEIRDIMFKLISNENKIVSNERRIDALETQFKSSMEELNTKLSTELNKITVTLKQYEPGMGEIRKDIQDTISNTVTQTVKSQYVILSKAMKQEKAAILKTRSEVKQQMRFMNTAFNSSQRNYEERFTNQTTQLQDKLNTQQERTEDLMRKELNETNEHMNQQIQTFEDFIANKTDAQALQNTQLINQLGSIRGNIRSYKSSSDAIGSRVSSLNSQMTSVQGDIRSYKSSSDAIGSRVSSIERTMTSSSAFTATGSVPYGSSSIRFPDVILNEGNDYNSATGVFTCRVPGLYLVTASIGKFFGVNVDYVLCRIQLNGFLKLQLYHDPHGDDLDGYTSSKTGTFRLQVNDRISVSSCTDRYHISNTSKTSFSAVLIRPDQL